MRLAPVLATLLLVAIPASAAIQVTGTFNSVPIIDCANSCGVWYGVSTGSLRFECPMPDFSRAIRTCTRVAMTPINYSIATGIVDLTCINGSEDLVFGTSGFEEGGNVCAPAF